MFVAGSKGGVEAVVTIVPPPPVERRSSPSITSAPEAHRSPSALATPGTERISSTSDSGIGCAMANWLEKDSFGATSTSTPL